MLKKKILNTLLFGLLLIIGAKITTAQDLNKYMSDEEYFIYLKDSTLLREGAFIKEKGLLQPKYYFFSGKRISLDRIKYMNTEKGYYAVQNGSLIKRQEDGFFDIFYLVSYSSSSSDNRDLLGGTTMSKSYYYSKGVGTLKSLKYKSISEDYSTLVEPYFLKKNELVLSYLNKGYKNRKTRRITMAAGFVAFLGGMILALPEEQMGSPKPAGMIVSALGIGTVVTSLFIKSDKYYLKSLQELNRTFSEQ